MNTSIIIRLLSVEFLAAFVLPFCLATGSMVIAGILLEWIVRQPWATKYHIVYETTSRGRKRSSSDGSSPIDDVSSTIGGSHQQSTNEQPAAKRWKDSSKMNSIPSNQLQKEALATILTTGILGSTVLYLLHLEMFTPDKLMQLPTFGTIVQEFLSLFYIFDFVFYLFHYACHKNDFLWKHVHARHHREHKPTALVVGYAELVEGLLGASMPILVGLLVVRPHALSFYAVLPVHMIAFGPYCHAGMQLSWMDILLLQGVLPFRANPRLHDAHHVKSGRQATNLGITTWIWDYLFGTMRGVNVATVSKSA